MNKGLFITFEGGDGSGKSTIIKLVAESLTKENKEVVLTREPGGTKISEDIRNIILDRANTKMDRKTEALLFAASRRQHLVEKIWPSINEGKIVLCDRYLDSSLAYQGGAGNLGIENVLSINNFATDYTFPNITFLFDLDPKIGLERINKNSNREVNRLDLEKIAFHEGVRKHFLYLSEKYKDRYVVIDASKSPDEIKNKVLEIINERLKNGCK